MANKNLSEFDRKVAAGAKVVAVGAAMLDLTPDELVARRWVGHSKCACGHKGWIAPYQLVARGLGQRRFAELAPKMICLKCGQRGPEVWAIDPYRSALDPD